MGLYTGKIIYWNKLFGFIDYEGESLFFHRSSLISKEIFLLDNVSFNIEITTNGIHKGKKNATQIECTEKQIDLNEFNRFVGRLQQWENRRGVIISPQQEKPIHFTSIRRLYKDDKFRNDDLLVFCPVSLHNQEDCLITLFAYHISRETDIAFLHKQYIESGIEQINQNIDQLANTKEMSFDEKFILKLRKLSYVDNQTSYMKLVSLLKEYYGLNHSLVFDTLKKICSNAYLIQLFEAGIIESYDIELIKTYFHNSLADNKRILITKFKESDKEIILQNHIELLRKKGQFEFLNDDIKTVLDIIGRNAITKKNELYSQLKIELLNKLDSDDIITLWLNDYIDELSEAFIVAEFDIRNSKQLRKLIDKEGEKFKEARKKIFENYFFNFKNKNFEKELGLLIQTLQEFERSFQYRYEEIISIYNSTFDNYQKFLLWIFGVKHIDFNINDILKDHHSINDYYKLKYLLRCRSEKKIQIISSFEDKIDFQGLTEYIKTNPWNDFIYPVASKEEEYKNINSFLSDVEIYLNDNSIDISQLALEIFESMPKYNTHHIRLWLHNWVNNSKYDYVGFRLGFKELTKEEQKDFRERGEELIKGEVQSKISNEIKPCKNIIESTKLYNVYSAYLYNFFFQEGFLKLKKEDETFTRPYAEDLTSRAFNDIPESNSLNKLEIKVTVDFNNNITQVEGLDLIFNTIHTKQIEKVLGVVVESESSRVFKGNDYVEDWELIKKIKDYLYAGQTDGVEVKLVNEPKNFYRRLDTDSGIDKYELTALFTHKAPQDYGIVWDNVDYSQDRAIYVFKSKDTDLNSQLQKIADAISRTAQFRSTLISSENDEMHELFKANLGYVGCIRKNKGELYSFEKFQLKLEKLFWIPTPILPTLEEQIELESWDPETPHAAKVSFGIKHEQRFQPRQMQASEIGKVDIPFFDQADIRIEIKQVEKVELERKLRIYNMLKTFNEMAQNYTV